MNKFGNKNLRSSTTNKLEISHLTQSEYQLVPSTLTDLLEYRTHQDPDREIYHYVEKSVNNKLSITYRELYDRASQVAKHLQLVNINNKPVLLLFNCNLDYIISYFGCLLAGQIAVPVYPPTASKHFDRLQSIINSCGSDVALLNGEIRALMELIDRKRMSQFALQFCAVDQLKAETNELPLKRTPVTPDSVAFLQFTSGSTGKPKGVMLSHKALLTNLKMIRENCKYTSEDKIAMWLPLYHDMGLIAGVLAAIYNDIPLYFMPPQSIVRPFHWLKLISDVKATSTGGPNFAFDMCINRISENEFAQLDLSSLRFIASGAEPVRSATVKKFEEKFKSAGLRTNAIMPCYGLAEACVFGLSRPINTPVKKVTIDSQILQNKGKARKTTEKSPKKIEYISCGKLDSTSLVIDPTSLKIIGANQVGELVLKGEHLMSGYWMSADATLDAFIMINGEKYLRTGDLVFADEDKDVYFCGRNKDMIILRGRNYYSTDLEISTNKAHPILAGMINAVFSIDKDATEIAVLVQELPFGTSEKDYEFIKSQIQQIVVEEHNLHFDEILFVPQGSIKRTSAGKVRRLDTKQMYLKNEIKPYKAGLASSTGYNSLKRKIKKSKIAIFVMLAKVKASVNQSAN